VRMFEGTPVYFRCRCSRERVENMLRSLGKAEVDSVIEEFGQVEVRCEFCSRAYRLDAVDCSRLFAAGAAVVPPDKGVH
jgi:molecular chaperone Hsp33